MTPEPTRAASSAKPRASAHRPLGWTLFGYLLREAVLPTALTLIGLSLAALTKSLLGLSDLLVNRGLSALDTGALVGFEIVVLAARILPFAVLLGALIALGRLAADRELLALETCGISPGRLLGPVLAVGALGTLLGLGLSLVAVPATLAARDRLLVENTLERPGSVLRAGTVQRFGNRLLSALETSSRGDDLRGVLLHAEDLEETLFAESAELRVESPGTIELTLHNGAIVTRAGKRSQLVRFKIFRTELDGKDAVSKPSGDEGRFAAASTRELWAGTLADPESPRAAPSELARRFSTPFAALALTWLAVPLALSIGRGSRGSGGVIGLAVTVVYYGLLQASNGLLQFPDVSIALAVWLPNAAALAGGAALMIRRFFLVREHKPKLRAVDTREVRSRRSRAGHHLALTRYVAARYMQLSLLAFGALFLAYLLVDVLERLDTFAAYGAQFSEVLHFYAARLPLLSSRVAPMGLLVGVALVVSAMSTEGELIGMEACGIRLLRGLASLMVIAALATPAFYLLLDRVLPQTNALADRVKEREIKDRAGDGWAPLWLHEARVVVHVDSFNPEQDQLFGLTLYELGPTGLPEARLDSYAARYVGHGSWSLKEARQTSVGQHGLQEAHAPEMTKEIAAIESMAADPMHLDLRGLAQKIQDSEKNGYDATAFRVDYQSRLAAPLQCLLLPWLGLIVAIGVRRPAPSLLYAIAIGVGFILVTGISVALGYGGWLSPLVAGWMPSGATAALAATLQLRR